MNIYSYELSEELWALVENRKIKEAYDLVEEAYEKFPKEPDCITSIVLKEMSNSTKNQVYKAIIEFLVVHLNGLKFSEMDSHNFHQN